MFEPRIARYPWGLPVRAAVDLLNDGSHPAGHAGDLLVGAGTRGEIVQVGHHAEAGVPVYLVDFGGPVLGVLEEEIEPAGPAAAAGGSSPGVPA